jgi:cob(I)alamin adenosyltransferase
MPDQADVSSVEAIDAFRSKLIVYLTKARTTIEEANSEVVRTRQWLENDQRTHWQRELRSRKQAMEQAQAELFSARISLVNKASAAQELEVHRAQRAIREVEAKMSVLKKWDRDLENRTEPLTRLIDQLGSFILIEMNQAVASLGMTVKALEGYSSIHTPMSDSSASISTTPEPSSPEKQK